MRVCGCLARESKREDVAEKSHYYIEACPCPMRPYLGLTTREVQRHWLTPDLVQRVHVLTPYHF